MKRRLFLELRLAEPTFCKGNHADLTFSVLFNKQSEIDLSDFLFSDMTILV